LNGKEKRLTFSFFVAIAPTRLNGGGYLMDGFLGDTDPPRLKKKSDGDTEETTTADAEETDKKV
jgi:hypothetical protein